MKGTSADSLGRQSQKPQHQNKINFKGECLPEVQFSCSFSAYVSELQELKVLLPADPIIGKTISLILPLSS